MSTELRLPQPDGSLARYRCRTEPRKFDTGNFSCRTAYAAAHVVADPLADPPGCKLDWEATLDFRRHLWSMGFGVAEAMDTAQRGMGLAWETVKELISISSSEARALGGMIASGAGTDQLILSNQLTLSQVIQAYEEQCEFIESVGSRIILMASRALSAIARGPEDYVFVYDAVLTQVSGPVILHWLGDMFDPALKGYWGYEDPVLAMGVCLDIIRRHSRKIEGIKLSLLDADLEKEMRKQLPTGIKMFTGDDFNYPDLILGDAGHHSHALLGIFDAIAPSASAALMALDNGDVEQYTSMLAPTVPLSRHIFQTPTQFYKTGLVFLAYLNGYQSHFRMVGGLESMRSVLHLSKVFTLADEAGLLRDPDIASERMRLFLALAGVL